MVLQESGSSTDTLVSLPRVKQQLRKTVATQQWPALEFRQTMINLPELDSFDDDESWNSCLDDDEQTITQFMYLPTIGSVDEHLPSVFLDARDELLLQKPVVYSKSTTSERLLYVCQGEVAHALPMQCDVLLTDKATTCHMLALRSESMSGALPLTSLTHIDGTQYSNCLCEMFQKHSKHHGDGKFRLSVHIVGGFNDEKETSRKLSSWLLQLIANIAQEHSESMNMVLQTCSISSLNDDGHGSPLGRGLAISTKTGNVWLAQCTDHVAGPLRSLRTARLLESQTTLICVHSETSNGLVIPAFTYSVPQADINFLLSLPDQVLLQYTSTSPHCEDEDFCAGMRATLEWVRDVPHTSVFCKSDLRFKRVGSSNQWKSVCGRFLC
ncbi:hypothetical protein MPSEU_000855600 [Mayamaea pseudoterrestris]|nr:hypothetical protein MPSEU_000855600 [Mayamaea pseudoterrestris]